jgi:hypothetical protein
MNLVWIPVQTELPPDMERVLFYEESEGLQLGYYYSQKKTFIREEDGSKFEEVSHWMPLPDAPPKSLFL